MTKQTQSRNLIWFVAAALAILCVGTGAAWLTLQSLQSRIAPSQKIDPSQSLNPTSPTVPGDAQVYWLSGSGLENSWVTSSLAGTKSLDKNLALQTALEQLLTQTPNPPASSAIPSGTRLLSVKSTDQAVYVNLSQSFGEGGGSQSMRDRLGQLIYTATSINPQDSVWIAVEGKPLEILGGEGLMIAQPINRQIFEADF
ncbi:MAG: GerMN domain-containing protein [Microcystaceae cyanobacterium]